ncbi:MAG TPA: DoxX family protein [Planctomycetota bacterium]|nr:DoxX family protein [Planctomycetota bacterium]
MDAPRRDGVRSFGLLILRLGVGGLMAAHGWGKVLTAKSGDLSKWRDPLEIGHELSFYAATAAEFGGAILVMIGLATRFSAAAVAFTMGVAAFVAHRNDPLLMGAGASKEPAILFMVPFLALVFTGAGLFSVDAALCRRRQERRAARP